MLKVIEETCEISAGLREFMLIVIFLFLFDHHSQTTSTNRSGMLGNRNNMNDAKSLFTRIYMQIYFG